MLYRYRYRYRLGTFPTLLERFCVLQNFLGYFSFFREALQSRSEFRVV
jgi:hypothetical protein